MKAFAQVTYLYCQYLSSWQELRPEHFAKASLSDGLNVLVQHGRVVVLVLVLSELLGPYLVQVIEDVAVVLFVVLEEAVIRIPLPILYLLRHTCYLLLLLGLLLIQLLVELLHLLPEYLRAHVVLMDRGHWALVVVEAV